MLALSGARARCSIAAAVIRASNDIWLLRVALTFLDLDLLIGSSRHSDFVGPGTSAIEVVPVV